METHPAKTGNEIASLNADDETGIETGEEGIDAG